MVAEAGRREVPRVRLHYYFIAFLDWLEMLVHIRRRRKARRQRPSRGGALQRRRA